MSTLVKYYNTSIHTGLAGYATNTAGSLSAILKTIFIDGFNSSTISTMTWAAGVVSVYVSTGHGFLDYQVVEVAGANEAGYNGEHRITYVDANNFTFPVAATLTTPSTGTRTVKAASLGWTRSFNTTDVEVFRPVDGNRRYYRLEEPTTYTVTRNRTNGGVVSLACKVVCLREYEEMASVSDGKMNSEMFIHKGQTNLTATGMTVIVVGDGAGAHVFTQNNGTDAPTFSYHFFGDPVPINTKDKFASIVMGKYGIAAINEAPHDGQASHYLHRIGLGASVAPCQMFLSACSNGIFPGRQAAMEGITHSSQLFGVGLSRINGLTGAPDRAHPAYVIEYSLNNTSETWRAKMPGLYNTGWHARGHTGYELVPNMGIEGGSRTMLAVAGYAQLVALNVGWAIDITGPWR